MRPACDATQSWSRSERRCVCRTGTYWDDDLEKCEEIDCGLGWKFDSDAGACAIDADYKHPCPDKMRWSMDSQRCVCVKGWHYSWKTTSCRRIDCGNKRKWSDSRNKCVVPDCDRNQIWRRKGGCQCRARYYMSNVNNICEAIPTCDRGDMWSTDEQECIEDPDFVGSCDRNEQWSRRSRKCVCVDNYFLKPSNNRCTLIDCDDDQKWNAKCLKCRLITCPQFAEWVEEDCSCECTEDYFFHPRKKVCVPVYCPDGFKFNFKKIECVRKGSSRGRTTDDTISVDSNDSDDGEPETPTCNSNQFLDTNANECKAKKRCRSTQVYVKATNSCKTKKKCRRGKIFNAEENKCVCEKACGLGRTHNNFCRCSIRTADCPKTKRCGNWRFRWNGAEGKCKCEKSFNF